MISAFISYWFSPQMYFLIVPDPVQWWCRFDVLKAVGCLAKNIIDYPVSAFNTFLAFLVDIGIYAFPPTPDHLKISNMLLAFSQQFPSIGWGLLFEIFNTCFIMLTIYLSIKAYKLLPFV